MRNAVLPTMNMNSQAIMNFIPVKLSILVQFLVCFGIIASTITITRSVVQSNLVKINANLEHLHRAGNVRLECPPTAVDNVDIEIVGLDYTKLHGYIVSNKDQRYEASKVVLDKLGIRPHQYVPLAYKSDAVRKAMDEHLSGDNSTKYHTDKYKKVFSNRMAFTDLFQQFVNDKRAELSSWRFFFEDDVQLHPFLTDSLAQQVLFKGMEVAAGDGIMYLGVCGPRNCQNKIILEKPVEASRCSGACTHAFGLTKWKTGGFLSYMNKLRTPNDMNVSSMYFDQLMRTYGDQVHKIWILGSNLKSPQVNNHFGLVFQDRTNFPSVINSKEPLHRN